MEAPEEALRRCYTEEAPSAFKASAASMIARIDELLAKLPEARRAPLAASGDSARWSETAALRPPVLNAAR
jgi:hypothetical protein